MAENEKMIGGKTRQGWWDDFEKILREAFPDDARVWFNDLLDALAEPDGDVEIGAIENRVRGLADSVIRIKQRLGEVETKTCKIEDMRDDHKVFKHGVELEARLDDLQERDRQLTEQMQKDSRDINRLKQDVGACLNAVNPTRLGKIEGVMIRNTERLDLALGQRERLEVRLYKLEKLEAGGSNAKQQEGESE